MALVLKELLPFFESQMPGRGKGNKIVGIDLSKKHLYLDYHSVHRIDFMLQLMDC